MSKLKITPLHDKVIIEPAPLDKITKGGIIIPDTAKEKPMQGKVVAVGNGTKDNPLVVKVGDNVLHSKHAGQPIKWDEKDYLIMKESEILAII